MSWAEPPPLILADTMMGLPGVKGIRVTRGVSPAAGEGLAAGDAGLSGYPRSSAFERKRSGTLSNPWL
jgi:hypothetical protein